ARLLIKQRTGRIGARRPDGPRNKTHAKHLDIVGNLQMPRNTNSAAQHTATADTRTAGYTHLAGQRGVITNDDVMGDVHLVVDDNTSADPGILNGTTVNGTASANVGICTDVHTAYLGNLDPAFLA